MKKLLQNTISILLLVFYLTGFCGLNLLKHSCFSCDQDDFHVVYDLDKCGDEMHVCEADSRPHVVSLHKTPPHSNRISEPCCSLELIYLKNFPKTLLKQVVKSPLVSHLYLHTDFQLQIFNNLKNEKSRRFLLDIIDPPKITQQKLCCYRC